MTPPRKVVLAPDIFVAALYDARARAILHQWRDGEILPVVTRDLLLLYLRTFSQAGLTSDLIRKWSLWFTAPAKSLYLENFAPHQSTGLKLCCEVAAGTSALLISLSNESGDKPR
ncbi:MAG: hypothetical protein ACXW32_05120 [Limisphaerales bacterium]